MLYDKNNQPIQKLTQVVRPPQNTLQTNDQIDSTPPMKKITPPMKVVVGTRNVSNESTDVARGTPESQESITIENSTFDKESNTIVVNATVNMKRPPSQEVPNDQVVNNSEVAKSHFSRVERKPVVRNNDIQVEVVKSQSPSKESKSIIGKHNLVEVVKSHSSNEQPKPVVSKKDGLVEVVKSAPPRLEESKLVMRTSQNIVEGPKAHSPPIQQFSSAFNTSESYDVTDNPVVQKTSKYHIDKSHEYIGKLANQSDSYFYWKSTFCLL